MPRRVDDYRGLTETSRLKLLHAIQRSVGRSLKDLAADTDLHINTARDHLRVLEEEGFIVAAPIETGRRGRPPMGYWPVERAEHSTPARQRAEAADTRGKLLRRLAPGQDHGQAVETDAAHQLDVLYEHLDDAGMEPHIDSEQLTVGVRPCLYAELLESERPMVCSVHASLVRQQLDQVDGPLRLRRLHPFTGPRSCLLVLEHAEHPLEEASTTTGIDADRSDAELEDFAISARRKAFEQGEIATTVA